MARLADKVALITGGESGIGLASARLFVSEGARVHLVGLDGDKLDAAVADLGDEHALATVADVTDERAVVRAIAEGVERYGRFDVLFSNAGISGAVAAIGEYPSDEFARTLAVHVLGAFHVLKHGAPHVPDGGSIIITSSVVGLMGFEGISGYIAAKHGQVGLMRAAAREYASRRIRVNTLHPGPTSTAFQRRHRDARNGQAARRGRQDLRSARPVRAPYDPGGDRARRPLSRRRRERDDDLAHVRHRRRLERLTASPQAGGAKTSRACQGSTEAPSRIK